ncbi:MAG: Hint domain-containing protein [Pseudomonadota bacterium]|nr:Hint domain-containing protein [Pseudomonadota bacterium]
MRVDGPQDVIKLDLGGREADLRQRAARKVRRFLTSCDVAEAPTPLDETLFDLGFVVTDGFTSWPVMLIGGAPAQDTLLMFMDGLPPVERDLWVVQARMEAAEMNRLTDQPTGVICFTPGTRIRTGDGDMAIEEIGEGTRIQTKDNGLQEVLWVGEKRISGARLYAMPEFRPIRVRQGALGLDRPDGDLMVSPAHRMLVKGRKAQALFGTDEVLVAARDLIDDRMIARDHTATQVTYIHLLLASHEVVFANGLETESFLPEGEALDAVEHIQRERLIGAMPSLGDGGQGYSAPARRMLTQAEAAIMGAGL